MPEAADHHKFSSSSSVAAERASLERRTATRSAALSAGYLYVRQGGGVGFLTPILRKHWYHYCWIGEKSKKWCKEEVGLCLKLGLRPGITAPACQDAP